MCWKGLLVSLMVAVTTAANTHKPDREESRSSPVPDQPSTVLRVAVSDEGLVFVETGEVFARKASRPEMVRLPNDELLVVFEASAPQDETGPDDKTTGEGEAGGRSPTEVGGRSHADIANRSHPRATTFWTSRSKDDGKTWLAPRPLQLRGLLEDKAVSEPDLIVMPSGLVRMYFSLGPQPDRPRSGDGTLICSAVTRDGLEYQLDRQVRLQCRDLKSARPSVFWTRKQMVLLATGPSAHRHGVTAGRTVVQQFSSPDGRTFTALDRTRLASEIGPVVQLDEHHWRMYISAGGQIRSRMSNDGIRWREESGVCLRGGFDPAVAAVNEKKFIMLFCAPLGKEHLDGPQLAALPLSSKSFPAESAGPAENPPARNSEDEFEASAGKDDADNWPGEAQVDADAGWEAFAPRGYESELGDDWAGLTSGTTDGSGPGVEGLAPVPDFRNKVDYIAWYEQNCIVPMEQNAFSAYGDLLDKLQDPPEGLFNDMYNGDSHSGPPEPWDPADHPEWEASYQATQDLLARFQFGSQDPRPYSCPLKLSDNADPEDRLLLGLLLPHLRGFRTMAKASLAQAWRTEGGIVPPEQMQTALQTVLGNAYHLQQGPTLIERLVGIAERNLADDTARWALRRGVFASQNDLQAAADMLREKDVPAPDPGGWVKSEHAWAMETVQYFFEPTTPGGEPEFRFDRVEKMEGMLGGPMNHDDEGFAGKLTVADARASAEAIDGWYREMLDHYQTRFPYESAGHFEDRAVELGKKHIFAGMLLPSLARASELMRRSEAARRGTRLAYSTELFRMRHGRYPASFDELPYEQVQDVRTDPYSRQDFIYRLTETGPLIYSVSNNGGDDGGVHSRHWGDDDRQTESDDFVFWPAQ